MRVLIDTNVVLDWLARREPFFSNAEAVMVECITGNVEGYLTSHMLTDLFYILRKDFDIAKRKRLLLSLCDHFQIIPEDSLAMATVLTNEDWHDLEDGLQIWRASLLGLDYIITRNVKDFAKSTVPALSPEEFMERYTKL